MALADQRKAKVTDEHRKEAEALRALWAKKEGRGTQAEFGEKFAIGNQSAVGQFLRGEAPLSLKAAKGFAKGLGCKIADFSPRLAKEAEGLHEVAPPPKRPFSFIDLNGLEAQLVTFYRGMSERHREDLLAKANALFVKDNPGTSAANPFPTKPPVKEHS